jgi:hypothetical protein
VTVLLSFFLFLLLLFCFLVQFFAPENPHASFAEEGSPVSGDCRAASVEVVLQTRNDVFRPGKGASFDCRAGYFHYPCLCSIDFLL